MQQKVNIRIILLLLICCLLSGMAAPVFAQSSFDEFKKQAREKFEYYKTRQSEDFNAYRARVNAEFAEFMANPWKKEETHSPLKAPEKKPDEPPVILPDLGEIEIPEDNEIEIVDIKPIITDDSPIPIVPIVYTPKPAEKTVDFVLYGTKCSVRFDKAKKSSMGGAKERNASKFWTHLSTGDYDNVLADCLTIKADLDLCDWAYYKLLGAASNVIYTEKNEANMLWAWLLNQSGFKIRLGLSGDRILLLVSACEDICGYHYLIIDGDKYYVLENDEKGSIYVFHKEFPQERSLRLSYTGANRLENRPAGKRALKSRRYENVSVTADANLNLLELYSAYPAAYRNNDVHTTWSIYANAPASEEMRETIYPVLRASIEGKTEREAANILINFVQTAFEYKTDDEVWGEERSFFPDETLHYPYSDCEDRAILYSRLVRDLMGLNVVLLYYPGHLATAVEFNESITGDYIVLSGHRYLVCDPTFINAEIGRTMPGMDNSKASVVILCSE